MAWNRGWGWVVIGAAAMVVGCGGDASPVEQLIDAQNRIARETCNCFYEDEGYTSAAECREAETIPFFGTNECEGRAYAADETGQVRANAECQADVYGDQADCYARADCDPAAFDVCDQETFEALAQCPQPTAEAQQAFQDALQDCLSGGTGPQIDGCPDDDGGSAVGSPAIMGSTGSSDNDLQGTCGGYGAPDEAIQWVAPQTGTVTIDTFGTDYDTVLYVLEGSCNGTELICNDDDIDAPVFQSSVTLDVTQGQTLIIVVDGFGVDDQGPFELAIQY